MDLTDNDENTLYDAGFRRGMAGVWEQTVKGSTQWGERHWLNEWNNKWRISTHRNMTTTHAPWAQTPAAAVLAWELTR